jgi:predicted amidohydrolase YtcJ
LQTNPPSFVMNILLLGLAAWLALGLAHAQAPAAPSAPSFGRRPVASAHPRPTSGPDLILLHGHIFTANSARPYVAALAIKGNKILATGTTRAVQQLATAHTKTLDLRGKTVVPGFNDAHDHLGWLLPGKNAFVTEFSVPGLPKHAVQDSLTRLVRHAAPGQWLSGTIGLTVFGDRTVRRSFLDSLAPHNPVVLAVSWGHGMVVNSQALRALGIADTAADPLGGWYERESGTRRLSGALYEYAQFPFWQALATANPQALVEGLRAHAHEELSLGITTVQNLSSTLQGMAARQYFAQAALPVRTRIIAMPGTTDQGRSVREWACPAKVAAGALTYFSGIKYVVDGTSLEQNSLRTTPYPGRPGWYGRLNFPPDTLRRIFQEALASDRQLLLHITGDSATALVLHLMKSLAPAETWRRHRVRIEHGTGITAAAARDVKALGLVVVHTPQYGLRSPLQTWRALGIPVAIGPDGVINPFLSILLVTTQQRTPGENLSREQAVMAYTRGSAYAEFAEATKGTLQPGMLADLAVLSQDVFSVPDAQLPAIHSVLTIVNGKIVYRVPEQAARRTVAQGHSHR